MSSVSLKTFQCHEYCHELSQTEVIIKVFTNLEIRRLLQKTDLGVDLKTTILFYIQTLTVIGKLGLVLVFNNGPK